MHCFIHVYGLRLTELTTFYLKNSSSLGQFFFYETSGLSLHKTRREEEGRLFEGRRLFYILTDKRILSGSLSRAEALIYGFTVHVLNENDSNS